MSHNYDFEIKTGDVGKVIRSVLRDENYEPVNLEQAAQVRFNMATYREGTPVVDAAGAIEQTDIIPPEEGGTLGKVRYAFQAPDIDEAGIFSGEWEVTWNDGSVTTYPTPGYLKIRVTAGLG